MCKLREGIDLVRIGAALQPELAAWRFGRTFHRRAVWGLSLASAVILAGPLTLASVLLDFLTLGVLLTLATCTVVLVQPRIARNRVICRIPSKGSVLTLRGAPRAIWHPPRGGEIWRLSVPVDGEWSELLQKPGWIDIEGPLALRVFRCVVARLNQFGALQPEIDKAVDWLEEVGNPLTAGLDHECGSTPLWYGSRKRVVVEGLPTYQQIALEIAASEDEERMAMDGELLELESAWSEAEEIAGIADNLLLPKWISDRIGRGEVT